MLALLSVLLPMLYALFSMLYFCGDSMNSAGRRFLHDKKGASLVTYVLVLPLFLLLVLGAYEVWRLIAVKESLYLGTYRAARYLAQNPDRIDVAEALLRWELDRSFAGNSAGLHPLESTGLTSNCDARFTIRAVLDVPWIVDIPYLPLQNVRFVEQHSGFVECAPYKDWIRPDPREGHTY
jgi:hypothetical protein